MLAATDDDSVLDIGTGTGGFLSILAGRPQRPDKVTGIDLSSGMLERVPRLQPGWNVQVADALALPFADASFDAASACYLLHTLDPAARELALAELGRVLRPGGRIVTVTPVLPRSQIARVGARPFAALADRLPNVLGGLRPLDPRAALQAAGFTLAAAEYVSRGYPSLCVLAWRAGSER